MEYKLIDNSLNDIYDVKKTIFKNRGIDNYKEYTNLNDTSLLDYMLLDNIKRATSCLIHHIENKSKIAIIVDCDVDGNTSASILYKYIKYIDNLANLVYIIHEGKQHGLSNDIIIEDDVNLVIIPDAGTNDTSQCKYLKEKGIDVIILDHHISDNINDYAIIVNNQMSDNYSNKELSGVGVVYKFLKALDDELWLDNADNMLDLVALGNIADNMDIRSYETKRLIDMGLNKIHNKLFRALIKKQEYSINNKITITNVQFYIVPLINAMIRVGTMEEKDMMFRAFLELDETFKYKKRGTTEEVDEEIYDRVARLCTNNRSKQSKAVEQGIVKIDELIESKEIYNDKFMFVNVNNILSPLFTGLVAIKIAEKYGRPCLLLRKQDGNDNFYGGSARNIDNSPIADLKDTLSNTNIFEFCSGHPNAFGVSIDKHRINDVVNILNTKYSDLNMNKVYNVDFDIDETELNLGLIKDICSLDNVYGNGLKEPYLHIEIQINKEQTSIMGKNLDSWKYISDDGYAIVKFKCKEDDKVKEWLNDEWSDNTINLSIVGKCSINNYNGILNCQVIVEDYDII